MVELVAYERNTLADEGSSLAKALPPSANGLGYARIPGLFNDEQVKGWHRITDGVHQTGGRIFVQK